MKELATYASKCTGRDGGRGPEVISFESVQGAFKQGRDLMQELRQIIEEGTGQKYGLSHILCSGATVGAAQMRHRYYFVAHRIPFGVDMPEKRRVCTYEDAIGDLIGLKQTWDPQLRSISYEQAWWLKENGILDNPLFSPDDMSYVSEVNSHVSADNGRIEIMLGELFPYWTEGKDMSHAMRNFRDAKGRFPFKTEHWWNEERDEMKGFAHPCRPARNRPGYVCTGGCVFDFIHYEECRMLSVRECSRLMGYPDAWDWRPAGSVTKAGMYIGKCCPVTTGRWIATWVKRALEGTPGSALESIGENEYVHNSTLLYKGWLKEQQAAA
jgi:site-specific DNA-cytosine methylase